MYRTTRKQLAFTDFQQPIGLELNPDNRWIRLAEIIPWDELERKYAASFENDTGNPSAPLRLAFGALLIQQRFKYSDRELVSQIQENPYFQFFCGCGGYDSSRPPFAPSALVGFRKRLAPILADINEDIIAKGKELLGIEQPADSGEAAKSDHATQDVARNAPTQTVSTSKTADSSEETEPAAKSDHATQNVARYAPTQTVSTPKTANSAEEIETAIESEHAEQAAAQVESPEATLTSEASKSDEGDRPKTSGPANNPSGASSSPAERAAKAAPAPETEAENEGCIILDASCCPANIRFPQDTSLLNEARVKAEKLIDQCHAQTRSGKKPRTYRRQAASSYKTFVLKRRHTAKEIRKQIRKQLGYLKRDLGYLRDYLESGTCEFKEKDLELLGTLETVFNQQKEMFDERKRRVDNRVVSISQPWIRPIVRGKAQAPTEFGIKIHLSISNGFARLDYASFDAFNESTLLQDAVEAFRKREGHYPERALADKIYRNRENLRYCKQHHIRLMGPRLGRPRKDAEQAEKDKQLTHQDGIDRIEVERAFSWTKRCAGVGKVTTKLPDTTECSLRIAVIELNLNNIMRSMASLCALIQFCVLLSIFMALVSRVFAEAAGTFLGYRPAPGFFRE